MARTPDPDRQREYNEERIYWIKSFLTNPDGLPAGGSIKKSQYFLEGKRLCTKPLHKSQAGPDKALIAEWRDGRLFLFNQRSSLGKQVGNLARELGIEVANDL